MGTKYTTTSLVGYNTSPPSDDGTQVDSNKVEWQKHLDKIGDPLKDQVAAIDAALVTYTDLTPVAKTSTYSVVVGDHQKNVECTGTFTVTLPPVATAGSGFIVGIKNVSTGTITVEGAGSETIDGALNKSLAENDVIVVQVDAATGEFMVVGSHDADAGISDTQTLTNKTIVVANNTITTAASGNLTSTELDAALSELQTDVDTRALSGANSDITSLTGLTTDLDVPQGGTGAGTFTDGGVLIGNGTGAVQATSAGTSGQVLISGGVGVDPNWGAASSGDLISTNNLSDVTNASTATTNLGISPWVEISRSTASASVNIEITTGIDATYKQYMVAFEGVVPATTGVYLQMQVGTGATPTWLTAATNYIYVNDLTASSTQTAFIRLSGLVVNTLTEGGTHGFLTFNDPSSTAVRQRFSFDTNSILSTGGLQRIVGAGQLRDTGAVTALRFYMSTGNIAVGDFVLYVLHP